MLLNYLNKDVLKIICNEFFFSFFFIKRKKEGDKSKSKNFSPTPSGYDQFGHFQRVFDPWKFSKQSKRKQVHVFSR